MRFAPLSIFVSAAGFFFVPAPIASPPRGFTAESGQVEREWEAKFAALPDPAHMREAMRRLSARPHHVGSPYGKTNAEWLLAQFKSYGWDAHIESFDVLYPTPKERIVEPVAPTVYRAKLRETALAADPTSGQTAEQLRTSPIQSTETSRRRSCSSITECRPTTRSSTGTASR